MNSDAKRARADYMKEWRKKNPSKNKEYLQRYWSKKASEKEQKDVHED